MSTKHFLSGLLMLFPVGISAKLDQNLTLIETFQASTGIGSIAQNEALMLNATKASETSIFDSYLNQIEQNLPPGWVMRLPSQGSSNSFIDGRNDSYLVRVFSFTTPSSLVVSLFRCDTGSSSCLVGSFSVSSKASTDTEQSFRKYQTTAIPVLLAPEVQGYLLEGSKQNSLSQFSSVMWEQDDLVYTIQFLTREPNDLLALARSMATNTPIYSKGANVQLPVSQEPQPETTLNTDDRATYYSNLDEPKSCPLPSVKRETERSFKIPQSRIEVKGVTVLDIENKIKNNSKIQEIIGSIKEQGLTDEAKNIIESIITKIYLDQGYITSSARIENFEMTDIDVTVKVIEGEISEVEILGKNRLSLAYICSRISLGIGIPVNLSKLEDQLRLLRLDPLFENVEATLQESGKGKSTLIVRVQEANPVSGRLSFDNYSPPSIGSERVGVVLRYRNLTGLGDEIAGAYFRSLTGGADIFDFSYNIPINPMNGTVQLRAAPNRNEVTQSPFDEFEIRGKTELYEVSFRQPFVRTPREEFALSLGFTYQEGQTFLFNDQPYGFGIGPDEDGVSRTSVIRFGQDYVSRDPQGAWSARSQFSFGTGLFNATTNNSPIPDGQFFSWLGQAQRVQLLGDNHLLLIQADLQLTPNTLLPSQQFAIGGGQSLRGYRQNARSGDNGLRFSIEDRIAVRRDEAGSPTIQIAPFIDLGLVWNTSGNPNELPDQTFLASTGLGLMWNNLLNVEGLFIRLDYGFPFINLGDRGGNIQDNGFYFQMIYTPPLKTWMDLSKTENKLLLPELEADSRLFQ